MRMQDMIIGIVGGGVVGSATARSLIEHVKEVRIFDIDPLRKTCPLPLTMEADIIFICLPTPQRLGSLECNTDYVEQFLGSLAGSKANLVLRSTIPIGTTRRLMKAYDLPNLIHSPEFLTARCALVDAQIPARMLLGAPDNSECANLLYDLYSQRWSQAQVYWLTSNETEAVKLFQNGFFAVKVAYWNEVFTLVEKLGLNWKAIMEAILSDGRIHPSHTLVPGPDGLRGFGGTCLPKDLANLTNTLQKNKLTDFVSSGALLRNSMDRQEEATK